MGLKASDYGHIQLEKYVNINDLYPQHDRLHGTETFMGDWGGRLLVIGQDFCHANFIRERLERDPAVNPYCHDPERTVNRRLLEHLKYYLPRLDDLGTHAKQCGALYCNIIWLLKDTACIDSRVPTLRKAIEVSKPTVVDTLSAMTRLEAILCVGRLPYEGLLQNLGVSGREWRHDISLGRPIVVNGFKVIPTAHRVANRLKGRFPSGYREQLVAKDIAKCFE